MKAHEPHPNSRRLFNPKVTNTNNVIADARLKHNLPYASTDKSGKPLSIARMVELCIEERGVKAPLPTGLADRVADLSLIPLEQLNATQREILRRLGGIRVAHATRSSPGLSVDTVPTSNGERVIQQAPFAVMVNITPELRRELNDDSGLSEEDRNARLGAIGTMVVDTVLIAEELAGYITPSSEAI